MKRTLIVALLVLVLAMVVVGGFLIPPIGGMGAGFYAKTLCSGVFVSNRSAEEVLSEDLDVDSPLSSLVSTRVIENERAAEASFLGLVKRKAIFREGLGCTIVVGYAEDAVRDQPVPLAVRSTQTPTDSLPWPRGSAEISYPLPNMVDSLALATAVRDAFLETEGKPLARTRAIAVVHRGVLVAEAYGPGWDRSMPLQSWSMAKSITNALVGLRVRDGEMEVDSPAAVERWQGDARSEISITNLLHMSSGLEFDEEYFNPLADAPQMLFNRAGAGAFATRSRLKFEPGSHWAYSSGTTNIIQELIRDSFEDRFGEYWSYAHQELFDRIGAESAIFEPDASGTFVGSSFMYATARDWARFGQLYLQDGIWNGERLFPEDWVGFSTTPAPAAPQGQYGAQIWLNAGDQQNPEDRYWPSLPTDLFFFSGFDGQYLVVIPSRDLVVVRLGLTQDWRGWDQEAFLRSIMNAVDD